MVIMQILKERGIWAKTQVKYLLGVGSLFILIGIGVCFLSNLAGGILALIGIGCIARSQSYIKGIMGERAVINSLKKLDDSYFLINDIVLFYKHGNIDHILLGPQGVFIIETKNYTGKIRCKGDSWERYGTDTTTRPRRRKYLPIKSISEQVKRNAATMKTFLEKYGGDFSKRQIPRYPIVAFTNPYVELDLNHPTVPILRTGDLCTYVQNQSGSIFSPQELEELGDIIIKHSVT